MALFYPHYMYSIGNPIIKLQDLGVVHGNRMDRHGAAPLQPQSGHAADRCHAFVARIWRAPGSTFHLYIFHEISTNYYHMYTSDILYHIYIYIICKYLNLYLYLYIYILYVYLYIYIFKYQISYVYIYVYQSLDVYMRNIVIIYIYLWHTHIYIYHIYIYIYDMYFIILYI